MEPMTAKLAGRKHHKTTITPTSEIAFVRERDNPVDHWAVRVEVDGCHSGYLETGLARLVAPLLDRGRPVFGAPIDGGKNAANQSLVNIYVPGRYDVLGEHGNLVIVPSSDGQRRYVVDRRHGGCTCPAGRFVRCRHQQLVGARDRRAIAAKRLARHDRIVRAQALVTPVV
jgi:hypothetical protein